MRELQKIRLRIPLKLPYKNQLTPSPDPNAWWRFLAVKREWTKAIPGPAEHQRATGERQMRIVRVMGPGERKWDIGNVHYASAAIIDIVAKKGWLVGDDADLCDLEKPVQRPAEGDEIAPSTYIEIKDLPGPAVRTARLPLDGR